MPPSVLLFNECAAAAFGWVAPASQGVFAVAAACAAWLFVGARRRLRQTRANFAAAETADKAIYSKLTIDNTAYLTETARLAELRISELAEESKALERKAIAAITLALALAAFFFPKTLCYEARELIRVGGVAFFIAAALLAGRVITYIAPSGLAGLKPKDSVHLFSEVQRKIEGISQTQEKNALLILTLGQYALAIEKFQNANETKKAFFNFCVRVLLLGFAAIFAWIAIKAAPIWAMWLGLA